MTWADHGYLYQKTHIGLVCLEPIQKVPAGNIPAGSLITGRDVKYKWIKGLGCLTHWIGLICRLIHFLNLHALSPYNYCSCRYCRPCRGIMYARKLLFRGNNYHYSTFYSTWNTNPSLLFQFFINKCTLPGSSEYPFPAEGSCRQIRNDKHLVT